MRTTVARKAESIQIRVSPEVLAAIMKESDPCRLREEAVDAILRRKYGLKPKGRKNGKK